MIICIYGTYENHVLTLATEANYVSKGSNWSNYLWFSTHTLWLIILSTYLLIIVHSTATLLCHYHFLSIFNCFFSFLFLFIKLLSINFSYSNYFSNSEWIKENTSTFSVENSLKNYSMLSQNLDKFPLFYLFHILFVYFNISLLIW